MNNAKKWRKTVEWGRLAISSRKLEIQESISCRDGHNKGQKQYGPNRMEEIKKKWQEYTEELYEKDCNYPDNYSGVVIHLELDVCESNVKLLLGSMTTDKANGGDGILAELFQIQKDAAVQLLDSACQKIWKTQQWPKDW